MTYVSGGASSFFSGVNPINSLDAGLDVNYDGNTKETLHGHDEWEGSPASADGLVGPTPGLDLQQVSAVGTISTIGPGGEAGALKPAGGGGALKPAGGGGALKPAGGGGALKPAGGGGLKTDITHQQANAYTRPPSGLVATEDSSPRVIHLSWTQPSFGQIVQYNVYRATGTGQFSFLKSVLPTPPATTFPPTTTTDNPSCKSAGYSYEVTAFVMDDVTQQLQESLPSNIVPTGDPLTGCYVVPNFSSPASATGNSSVPITWTLTDDFYTTNGPVTKQAANTKLVANGPIPNHCKTVGTTTLLLNGTAQSGFGTFTNSGDQFTFTWNTKGFCTGSYTFELDLDSSQKQTTAPPLVLK
jgi:hypothetical protein